MTLQYIHKKQHSEAVRGHELSMPVDQAADSISFGWKGSSKVGQQRTDTVDPRKETSEKSNRTWCFLKEQRKILES